MHELIAVDTYAEMLYRPRKTLQTYVQTIQEAKERKNRSLAATVEHKYRVIRKEFFHA